MLITKKCTSEDNCNGTMRQIIYPYTFMAHDHKIEIFLPEYRCEKCDWTYINEFQYGIEEMLYNYIMHLYWPRK